MLLSIIWNADPVIFSIGTLSIRWYGLLYALGFFLGITLIVYALKKGKREFVLPKEPVKTKQK